MKTYTIEGATWAPKFMQKFWFTAANVVAKNKTEALRQFKETIAKGTDSSSNVVWENTHAPNYVSYRIKLNH